MRFFIVRDIDQGGKYAVWPFWLLISLGITLALSINLVAYSSRRANAFPPSSQHMAASRSAQVVVSDTSLRGRLISSLPKWVRKLPQKPPFFWIDFFWFVLWLLYIVSKYSPTLFLEDITRFVRSTNWKHYNYSFRASNTQQLYLSRRK